MAKYSLSKQDKIDLKDAVKSLPKFPRVFKNGVRKGTPIFKEDSRMHSGANLQKRGITHLFTGEEVKADQNYYINLSTEPQMMDPYEQVLIFVQKNGVSPELLDQFTRQWLVQYGEVRDLLEERKNKLETKQGNK